MLTSNILGNLWLRTGRLLMDGVPRTRRFCSMPHLQTNTKINQSFFLSVLNQQIPLRNNCWNRSLIHGLIENFSETKIYDREKDGTICVVLREGKYEIPFKGVTPLEAIEDLQDRLQTIDDPALATKAQEISRFVVSYVKRNTTVQSPYLFERPHFS